jgi:hypothetical protein
MKRSFALLLLAATACQSTTPELSDSWGALPVLDRVEIEYRGSLRTTGDAGLKIPEFEYVDVSAGTTPPAWMIQVSVFDTSQQGVHRLIGESAMTENNQLSGGVVSLEEMQRTLGAMVDAGDAALINEPRLVVFEGSRASMTVANQTAFIDHFDFERTPTSILMDPEIGVFMSGLLIDMVPQGRNDDGKLELEFHLTLSELIEMNEVESSYPLGGGSLTIQVPVFMRQDLNGLLTMSKDQAVVLPVLYAEGNRRLLIVVHAKSVAVPDEAPAAELMNVPAKVEPSSEDEI